MCSIGTVISTLAAGVTAYASNVRSNVQAQRANKYNYTMGRQAIAADRKQLSRDFKQSQGEFKKNYDFRVQRATSDYDESVRKLMDNVAERRRQAREALARQRTSRARSGLRPSGSRLDALQGADLGLVRQIEDYQSAGVSEADYQRRRLLESADYDFNAAMKKASQRYNSGLDDLSRQSRLLSSNYTEQRNRNRGNLRFGLLSGLLNFGGSLIKSAG